MYQNNQKKTKTYFSDEEYRILLSALNRERKVCQKIDKTGSDINCISLGCIMDALEEKIRKIQYPRVSKILMLGIPLKSPKDGMRQRRLTLKDDSGTVVKQPVIFDWRAFESADYTEYEAKMENSLLYSGDYIGCVRIGDLLIDLSVYSRQQDGPITEDDEVNLCLDMYVGGIDTGYAYGRNGYPYDRVDDGSYRFEDEMIAYDYPTFQTLVENKIVEMIRNSSYITSDLISKMLGEPHVW